MMHVTAYLMQICAVPTGQRTASGWGRDPCAASFWTKCLHLKGTFSPLWSSVTVLRRWLPKCRWICKQVQPREPPSQPCIYPCDWPGTHWRLLAGRRRPAVSTGQRLSALAPFSPAQPVFCLRSSAALVLPGETLFSEISIQCVMKDMELEKL